MGCIIGCGEEEKIVLESITVSPAGPVNMVVGDKQQLTATAVPANASDVKFEWTSGSTLIASVSADGEVEAKADGNTTVTVRSGNVSKSVSISVSKAPVPLTAITLDKTETQTIRPDEVLELTATLVPADATGVVLEWTSSYPNIAFVSSSGTSGEVTGLTAGTTTITVSAGTITASLTVIVENPPIPLTGIMVNVDENALTLVKGEQRQLIASPVPELTTDIFAPDWTSANTDIVTVTDGGLVSAIEIGGPVTITVSQGDIFTQFAVTVIARPIVEIPKTNWSIMTNLPSDVLVEDRNKDNNTTTYTIPSVRLFDGDFRPQYPAQGVVMTVPPSGGYYPFTFTVDIGCTAILKSLKLHQMGGGESEYRYQIKDFKLYGTADASPSDDLNNGWTLLGGMYTFPQPPSDWNISFPNEWGLPNYWANATGGTPSAWAVLIGAEFTITNETPVKYIRIEVIDTFWTLTGESRNCRASELTLTGSIIDN
jgi:uncharacterized protein YjdB